MESKTMVIAASLVVLFTLGTVCGQAPSTECPAHSTFSTCMTRCPVTCSNYQNQPASCVQGCIVGCECEEGFVKIGKGPYAACVKKYECPLYTTKRARPYPNTMMMTRKHQLIREMIAARRVTLDPSTSASKPTTSSTTTTPSPITTTRTTTTTIDTPTTTSSTTSTTWESFI